ncbi:MAG: hypothetical protein ABIV51_11335 [Saprospiraceae bacterium]
MIKKWNRSIAFFALLVASVLILTLVNINASDKFVCKENCEVKLDEEKTAVMPEFYVLKVVLDKIKGLFEATARI